MLILPPNVEVASYSYLGVIKVRCCTILIATCGSVERSYSSAVENWPMGIVADIEKKMTS